jgi:phosphoglycerol transferase MdoB-like AlkP superfamily enzyme
VVRTKVKRFSEKCSSLLAGLVDSNKSSLAFMICLWALALVYRIQLTIGLFTNRVRPFDFIPAHHPVRFTLALLPYDLALVIVCFLCSWLLSRITSSIRQSRARAVSRISGLVFLHIVLMILILIHGIHGRLLFDVQTGFDASVIREAFSGISFVETLKLIEIRDYLFLLFPFALFWLVFISPVGLRIWMGRASMVWAILLLSLFLWDTQSKTRNVPDEIRLNPTVFLLSDVAGDVFFSHSARNQHPDISKTDRLDTSRLHSRETRPKEPEKTLPAKRTRPWNIVFLIMESVGSRYVFDTSHGTPMPMPFLHKMSQEGWFLKKHYTTSNVSTKAVFSLLSGCYDFFNRGTLGTRPDAHVPAIYGWLGEGYDSFLVTPSSTSWYFPTNFVKNSGLSEIHSYENLKFMIREEFHSLGHYIARDEIQTMDFFIQRLSQAREPFLGIYISFTAHFPYFDYGEDYRIMKDDGRLISRYYNNLYLLDRMIKRIYDHLRERGLLEHTILVVIGDHGQAFGQHHPNNFMHYRYSYNENLETPAIFYQPALFKPKTVVFPTSHVDILPTLLDAMRVSYSMGVFDGESLFNYKSKRKPIFFYGYEESFSSLDSHLIKVQYSLKKKRCWVFDLKRDPDEKNPLDCSLYPHEVEGLHRFVSDHDSSLLKYNATVKEKNGTSGSQAPVARRVN